MTCKLCLQSVDLRDDGLCHRCGPIMDASGREPVPSHMKGACPDCQTPTWKPGSRCKLCHAASLKAQPFAERAAFDADAGAMASRDLLRAQLKAGLHWITDANRFAAVCESVGLAA